MKHKKRGPAFPLLPNESEYCYVGDKKKRKYETELDAELTSPSKMLHQYICDFCGHWHNGNSTFPKNTG
ncbi:hypothetical protein H7100_02125 [Candidatus Saccharibacteria bacterium]|nr:hypothetical protein [Candidatus Saccharibacteria bacterium]